MIEGLLRSYVALKLWQDLLHEEIHRIMLGGSRVVKGDNCNAEGAALFLDRFPPHPLVGQFYIAGDTMRLKPTHIPNAATKQTHLNRSIIRYRQNELSF